MAVDTIVYDAAADTRFHRTEIMRSVIMTVNTPFRKQGHILSFRYMCIVTRTAGEVFAFQITRAAGEQLCLIAMNIQMTDIVYRHRFFKKITGERIARHELKSRPPCLLFTRMTNGAHIYFLPPC